MKFLALFLVVLATVAQAGQQPAFQMDTPAKRKLIEKAMALNVGDSIQTVTNTLGKPTYDQTGRTKETGQFISRSLKYYAVIWERGGVNELHDELVDVRLDEKDRVRSVRIRVTIK